MKKIVFIVFSVIVIAFAWFYSDLWLEHQSELDNTVILQREIAELKDNEEVLQERLQEQMMLKNNEKMLVTQLKKELELALMPVSLALDHKNSDASQRFLRENANLWFLPGEDQAMITVVEKGTLVKVFQETVNLETQEVYLYVEIPNYADPTSIRGYILKDKAIYFTPDLEKEVINPIKISKGSTVMEGDGDSLQEIVLEEDLTGYLLRMEADVVVLGTYGGREVRTALKNIVYPESSID